MLSLLKTISVRWLLGVLVLLLGGCRPLSPTDEFRLGTHTGPIPDAYHFVTPTPGPSSQLIIVPTPVALSGPVSVALAADLPEAYAGPIRAELAQTDTLMARNGPQALNLVADGASNATRIEFAPLQFTAHRLLERYYAVVAPFDTLVDDISFSSLAARWSNGDGSLFATDEDEIPALRALLGVGSALIVDESNLRDRLATTLGAVALVPFDRLDPTYKVLTIDGVSVLDNQLRPGTYPLAAGLHVVGEGAPLVAGLLRPAVTAVDSYTNRDADALTHLIMTGVTAMSRGTAARMERDGLTFPAKVISPTLRAADITHVSNEVPFLDDCEVDNTINNLILCSHTDYVVALEAIGADIVGLSGNHVNDFGREGARRSLEFYRDQEIPIYGSGLNEEEACRPLLWSHNDNRLAFVAALAFGPTDAWATAEEPGACYYYDNKEQLLDLVADLATEVDIVAVELQFVETYEPFPTPSQIDEFRQLREAGAHIVTGVQSHVPQALEPYGATDPGGAGIIAYGLGNLFFDQMWSWETRTELLARHVIYEGRLLSTEILTAVLEHYAQPRWATPDERAEILTRIFDAAPPRPAADND